MDLPIKSKPKLYPTSVRYDRDERAELKRAARRRRVAIADVIRVGSLDLARRINAETESAA